MADQCYAYIRVRDGSGSISYCRPRLAPDAADSVALAGAARLAAIVAGSVYALDVTRVFYMSASRPPGGSAGRLLALQLDDPPPAVSTPITLYIPTVSDSVFLANSPVLDTTNAAVQAFATWAILNARETDGTSRSELSGGVLTIESK